MKEKFIWKDLIKHMGGTGKFISFIVITALTIASAIWGVNDLGLYLLIESIFISILIDQTREYIKVLKEVNSKFTIKEK